MKIKITSRQILKILYALSWIIFIGVCIEAVIARIQGRSIMGVSLS